MPATFKTLFASFNLPIQSHEISWWRGAFSEMAGWEHDHLHNHQASGALMYRFPKVQYRVWKHQAALFALNDAIPTFQKIIAQSEWKLRWKKRSHQLLLEQLDIQEHELKMLSIPLAYRISNYIALNQENYQAYLKSPGLSARADILERSLVGHILGFCTEVGWKVPNKSLEVHLQDIHTRRVVRLVRNDFMAFDLTFHTNILLPEKVALGKKLAFGCGTLKRVKVYDHTPS